LIIDGQNSSNLAHLCSVVLAQSDLLIGDLGQFWPKLLSTAKKALVDNRSAGLASKQQALDMVNLLFKWVEESPEGADRLQQAKAKEALSGGFVDTVLKALLQP
jgi:hypothetical protein